jgi:hypothetical protein
MYVRNPVPPDPPSAPIPEIILGVMLGTLIVGTVYSFIGAI